MWSWLAGSVPGTPAAADASPSSDAGASSSGGGVFSLGGRILAFVYGSWRGAGQGGASAPPLPGPIVSKRHHSVALRWPPPLARRTLVVPTVARGPA